MEIGTVLILAGTTVAAGLAIIAAYTLAARQRSIQKKSNGSSSSLVTTVETRA